MAKKIDEDIVEECEKQNKSTGRFKRGQSLGFSINDCPLWLVKRFTTIAEERFNDCYWATLNDLVTKAEAYEQLLNGQGYLPTPEVEYAEETAKNSSGEVVTMDGKTEEDLKGD